MAISDSSERVEEQRTGDDAARPTDVERSANRIRDRVAQVLDCAGAKVGEHNLSDVYVAVGEQNIIGLHKHRGERASQSRVAALCKRALSAPLSAIERTLISRCSTWW